MNTQEGFFSRIPKEALWVSIIMDKAIQIGSKIKAEINGLAKEIIIVETQNVNPETGRISELSPIGSALIGHESGDKFEVKLNNKKFFFNILKVI